MGLEWKDSLLVGVEKIDSQHKELFQKINDFLMAMGTDQRAEEMARTFKFLEDYVVFHFDTEEELMKRYNYPDLDDHKVLHKDFKESLSMLKTKLEVSGANLSLVVETNKFLSSWLVNHIGVHDKRAGAFLIKNGAGEED
jgi:hemerythrin